VLSYLFLYSLILSYLVTKNYCLLIPSLIPSGPVKGAIAFANAIAHKRTVKIISLKAAYNSNWKPNINPQVECICLAEMCSSWFSKRNTLKHIFVNLGGKKKLVSISMCFSADFMNLFCSAFASTFSSVRGNLPINYRMDFGFLGLLLSYFHLFLLRSFNHVAVMSDCMANQVSPYLSKNPIVIGNFIDELPLERFRHTYISCEKFKYIFVGSLTERKQPLLLLESINVLLNEGFNVCLDIVGTGPLEPDLREFISKNNLSFHVTLHGHVDVPYPLMSQSDAFVLPSLSEGIPRAALESLHLGLPCILRNVDGNHEFITPAVNGDLFTNNENLLPVMKKLIKNPLRVNHSLLPPGFRQIEEVTKVLNYLEVKL
jgi:glycosyltransferase involved in cell wall biosynthesis